MPNKRMDADKIRHIDQPNPRRVMFRYVPYEHPDLHDWLDAQTNKTQSVIAALTVMANKYGRDQDFIQAIMQENMTLQQSGGYRSDLEPYQIDDTDTLEYKPEMD